MASQRHKLLEQGATAAGEVIAEGVVAIGVLRQTGPTITVPAGGAGGPLSGSSLTGAPSVKSVWPNTPAAVLTTLTPDTAPINTGDVEVTITGTGFVPGSMVTSDGLADTSIYVSATSMKTVVNTNGAAAGTDTITVLNGAVASNGLTFTLTAPGLMEGEGSSAKLAEPSVERIYPLGPANIGLITDNVDGIQIDLMDALDVRVGDTVLIEATFNSATNGEYTVLAINPLVVDNNFTLEAPIENKGRLTVTAGA